MIHGCSSDSDDESEPGGDVRAHQLPEVCTLALLYYSFMSRFAAHVEVVARIRGTSALMLLGCGRAAQRPDAGLMAVT